MPAVETKEDQKEILRGHFEEGGARRVVAYIQGQADPEARRALYAEARLAFDAQEPDRKDFDDLILIGRTGMQDALRQAEDARALSDEELARKCVDAANVLAYNLAADLCECWPGDEKSRERRHLEAGLEAASRSVVWRNELGKPPDRRAMAYWAVGMHQVSLGNLIESAGAFETALRLAAESVAAGKGPLDPLALVKGGGDFGVVLYAGYAGIARRLLGDPVGAKQYDRACAAFTEAIAKHPDQKEDAEFGLEQLRWVEKRFAARK